MKRYLQIRSSGGAVRIFQIDNLYDRTIYTENETPSCYVIDRTLMRAFISLWRITLMRPWSEIFSQGPDAGPRYHGRAADALAQEVEEGRGQLR